MSDNITLPREVVEEVLEALEHAGLNRGGIYTLQRTMLRTALAAPKPEPVASDDDEEFTREDVTTLLLEVMDWTYAKAHRNRPMTEAEQKVLNDIRTHLAAEQPKQEAKQEPVAYFDLQKQVFYWARPTMIDVPMTIALEPLPLYAAPPEDEALRRENERLRGLLTEARGAKWLVVQDNLLDRIDAALRREDV